MATTYVDPTDTSLFLEDGGSAFTTTRDGKYSGAARIYDFGAAVSFQGFLVYTPSVLDQSSGNEHYIFNVKVSSHSDFSSDVVTLYSIELADLVQRVFPLSNLVVATPYRYMKIEGAPTGTTPSITTKVWVMPYSVVDDFTLAQLTKTMGVTVEQWEQVSFDVRAWSSGTVTGGPNSDGYYPLRDLSGTIHLVACPALLTSIAADATFTADRVLALPQHTAEDPDTTADDIRMLGVFDPTGTPVLKQFSLFLFASRKTKDLQRWTDINDERSIGNLQLQMLDPTSGNDYRVTVDELMRVTNGVIKPKNPPYNCRFDAHFTRGVASTSGSHTLTTTESVWNPDDVGKKIGLSNAGASGFPMWTTIATYVSHTEITITTAPSTSFSTNDCAWGTDDTAGMQSALDDAEGPAADNSYDYGSVVQLPSGRRALVGSLKLRPRMGLFGKGIRQSGFIRYDDGAMYTTEFSGSQPAPTLWNESRDADFVALGDFAINGNKFCQTLSYPGLVYWSRTGGENMPQVDPYPMFTRMHIFGAGWDGIEFRNRHSGTCAFVEVINCGGIGFNMGCYDANIINVLTIGNQGPGLFVQGQGANNNFINAKVSFSGVNMQWLYGDWIGAGNVVVEGAGNNFENMRVQESYGSNIIIIGQGNNFTGTQADDTGCIFPVHGFSDGNLPVVRAAILIVAGAKDNRLNDMGYGPAVHLGSNFATHGVYIVGDGNPAHDPTFHQGRIFTKGMTGLSYYGSGTGDFTPGAVGFTAMSAIDPSNSLVEIDGTPIV